MTIIKLNKAQNGIELHFGAKPEQETLNILKRYGFRYSFRQAMWYAKQSAEMLEVAKSLAGEGAIVEEIEGKPYEKKEKAPKKAKKAKKAKKVNLNKLTKAELIALIGKMAK